MFKMQLLTQADNHKNRKNVATDKNFVLWEMDFKFQSHKFNLLCKAGYFLIKNANPLELRS